MDRGAWWATVHRVTKRQTRLCVQVFDEFQMCVCVCVCVCVYVWHMYAQSRPTLSMEFFSQENWSGVAISYSRGSSRPRDQTQALCLLHWQAGSFFFFINWRLITLQYCSGFCHTLTWISHGFTCAPHPHPPSCLPLHPIPLGLPIAPALSTCLMNPSILSRVKQIIRLGGFFTTRATWGNSVTWFSVSLSISVLNPTWEGLWLSSRKVHFAWEQTLSAVLRCIQSSSYRVMHVRRFVREMCWVDKNFHWCCSRY